MARQQGQGQSREEGEGSEGEGGEGEGGVGPSPDQTGPAAVSLSPRHGQSGWSHVDLVSRNDGCRSIVAMVTSE